MVRIIHKWYIEVLLNCGKYIYGEDFYPCDNSVDVGTHYLSGNKDTIVTMGGINSEHKTQIFFKRGDVACMKIRAVPFVMKA